MDSFEQIRKSKLLGFDQTGHPLWPSVCPGETLERDQASSAARSSGAGRNPGIGVATGTKKDYDEPDFL